MKRHDHSSSDDSFGGPAAGDLFPSDLYSVFGGMDDDECGNEELCSSGGGVSLGGGYNGGGEKKRRLSTEQVRALERSFEVENKLEPDRKLRLALDLGLQPRQVAVWFQNRRARWKTKQLERDYSALSSRYNSLKSDFDALHHDKSALLAQIRELKSKLAGDESFSSTKEDPAASGATSDDKASDEDAAALPSLIYKDGSPDSSDSSAVLNDRHHSPSVIPTALNQPLFKASSSFKPDEHHHLDYKNVAGHHGGLVMKMDDQGGFEEVPCSSFFSDEQPPTLSWYCSEWS